LKGVLGMDDDCTYENVVMRNPESPKPAVQAGMRQAKTLTTTMMAKQDQKERPIDPPIVPTLRVATAMFALSLGFFVSVN